MAESGIDRAVADEELALLVHRMCVLLTKRRRRAGRAAEEAAAADQEQAELLTRVQERIEGGKESSSAVLEAVMVVCRMACEQTLPVLELLTSGEDITTVRGHKDQAGNSTLLICAQQCHGPSLRLLLANSEGALGLAGERNDQGSTVLHKLFSDPRKNTRAFTDARAECIGILLEASREPAALLAAQNKHGNTALHKAVRQCSATACGALLDAMATHGVTTAACNAQGATAMHLAAAQGKDEILQRLLAMSDSEAVVAMNDSQGNTPLHCAVMGEQGSGASASALAVSRMTISTAPAREAIVRALAEAGADVSATNSLGQTALHLNRQGPAVVGQLIALGADAVQRDTANGWLPVQHATAAGRLDLTCRLLEVMAEEGHAITADLLFPPGAERQAESILHAAARSEEFGHELVQHMRGLPIPKEELERRNGDSEQPIHVACRWNNVDVLQALLPSAQEEHMLDSTLVGHSALSIAVQDLSVDCIGPMVERLLELQADSLSEEVRHLLSSARSSEGLSLLHRAAQVGDIRTLALLVDKVGMDPANCFVSTDGFEDDGSPLHLACRRGQEEACQWLLSRCLGREGWNVNCCNNYGRCTALHLACEAESPQCVKMLLAVDGVDTRILSRTGETAMELALGSPECMQLLRQHHAKQPPA